MKKTPRKEKRKNNKIAIKNNELKHSEKLSSNRNGTSDRNKHETNFREKISKHRENKQTFCIRIH